MMWGSWGPLEKEAARWAINEAVNYATEQIQYSVARWRAAAFLTVIVALAIAAVK